MKGPGASASGLFVCLFVRFFAFGLGSDSGGTAAAHESQGAGDDGPLRSGAASGPLTVHAGTG